MTEDEGEADNDSSERNKGCDRVIAVEDEQADENQDQSHYGDHDCVELAHSRANILTSTNSRLSIDRER